MLVSTNRHFIQILEGEISSINALFNIIKNDNRHNRVQLNISRPIEKRTFGAWSMNIINIHSISSVLYGYNFDGSDIDPYAMTYNAISELILRSARRQH